MILPLIHSTPADTPLREILHPIDCYELFDELEESGMRAEWAKVLQWQREGTVGDVLEWYRRVAA